MKLRSQDLEAVWQAPTTTNQDRKQLLRAAIEEVQLRTEAEHYAVKIVLKGGVVTENEVRRRKRGDLPVTATPKDTVELVRTLAAEFDDARLSAPPGARACQRKFTGGNPYAHL